MALIPGFAAREVMVGSLATVYAVEEQRAGLLGEKLKEEISLPSALSLIVWYILACQCLSASTVTRRVNEFVEMTYVFAFVHDRLCSLRIISYLSDFTLGGAWPWMSQEFLALSVVVVFCAFAMIGLRFCRKDYFRFSMVLSQLIY